MIILTSGTDGSCVLDEVSGASFSGSGFSAHFSGQVWRSRRWGHLDDSGPVVCLNLVWVFALCLVFFRMFRELSFGSYLSLQATGVVHLEVDNLIVVRHVGGLILLVCWCSSHGDVGWWMTLGTMLCCLVFLLFGPRIGYACVPLSLLLMTYVLGHILLGFFLEWVAFQGTLQWPASRADLGVGGVSCVELLL